MPARAERIHIVPDKNGNPGRIIGFPGWWDRSAFFDEYRDREIDLGNPVDAHFVYVLSSAHGLSWIRRQGNEEARMAFNSDAGADTFTVRLCDKV
jgi:hypothetical protein